MRSKHAHPRVRCVLLGYRAIPAIINPRYLVSDMRASAIGAVAQHAFRQPLRVHDQYSHHRSLQKHGQQLEAQADDSLRAAHVLYVTEHVTEKVVSCHGRVDAQRCTERSGGTRSARSACKHGRGSNIKCLPQRPARGARHF